MHRSVSSCSRVTLAAMIAISSLDSVALAQGHADHATTKGHADHATPKVKTAPASRQFEIRFLEGMIDHHAMAVHMSKLLQVQAVHPELRLLGDSISVAQSAEITQMQAWLKEWYGRTHKPAMAMGGMGMMEKLKGEAFEKEYLRMMIRHHASAVQQAKTCERRAKHTELHDLCHRIGVSQQREIATMKDWRCRWYKQCK